MAAPKQTRKKRGTLLCAESPEMFNAESGYALEERWHGGCRMRRHFHPKSQRPGGTVAGPIMMALVDFAMYLAVLSAVGWVPLRRHYQLFHRFPQNAGTARPLSPKRA